MQIQIVGIAGLPGMRLSENNDVLLKFWQESKDARHLEIDGDFYRLVIFAWWNHPFPSRTRK